MGIPATVEERLDREREFHDDRYREEVRVAQRRFYSAESDAKRRFALAMSGFGSGDRILELGCGPSSAGWNLASAGAEVLGIDVSPVAIAEAEGRAAELGIRGISFREMNAEALDLATGSVDGVVGTGILHHLDMEAALGEIRRVLRPTGRAVFLEPLGHNPFINLYRWATPDARTVDEHPLRRADIVAAGEHFLEVDVSTHELLTIAAAPVRGRALGRRLDAWLSLVDRHLLRLPGARWLAWIAVLELRQPLP